MNYRTDIAIDFNKKNVVVRKNKNIEILESKISNYVYHTIKFNSINNSLINTLRKELIYFINNKKYKHVLVIGIGNEFNTADSIGPKTIKNIKVNFSLDNVKNNNNIKLSAFIPGVLGMTGIETNKTIKCLIKEIKPDLIILIDSLVTNNINYINRTIEISNKELNPGSGILGNNKLLNIKTPIISIGVPTSLEYIHNKIPFLLTPSNIDSFISDISEVIGNVINDTFYNVLSETPL